MTILNLFPKLSVASLTLALLATLGGCGKSGVKAGAAAVATDRFRW